MDQTRHATAIAPANIAFIKYWGLQDVERTLPYNGSISMNLDACLTTTTVTFDPALAEDEVTLTLYGKPPERAAGRPLERVGAARPAAGAGRRGLARAGRIGEQLSLRCRDRLLGRRVRRADAGRCGRAGARAG